MQSHSSTKRIALTGLMAAFVVAGSAIRITLPLDIAGTTSFHLGNILCALSGILLGPWLGAAAAGIGSALYDLTNPLYVSEAWITFLFKGAYGLAAGLIAYRGMEQCSYRRAIAATTAGAAAYAVLYLLKSYFYNGMLVSGLTPATALVTLGGKLPATIFNAVIAIIFAPVLAMAIQKALQKQHLRLN